MIACGATLQRHAALPLRQAQAARPFTAAAVGPRRPARQLRSAPTLAQAAQAQPAPTSNGSTTTVPPPPAVFRVVSFFLGLVRSEWQLMTLLKIGVALGKVPQKVLSGVEDLYSNYRKAILGSGLPGGDEAYVAKVMASVVERVLLQFLQPFTFSSHHTRIQEPYNYYEFGQRYVRGLVDFNNSLVGHRELFEKVKQQLAAGDNVVLLANHQTEADPAVWALLLEDAFPHLATDVIYVAGDRVVTDALCKPFSMGRNLFCVHSKKHIDDYPELKAEKMAMNRRTLKAMQQALNQGGQLLWIAPSGGRDRSKDPANGEQMPDVFDPSAVELMRALLTKAKPAGHLYPLAMYSYKIMPPPATLEKAVGEKRVTNHAPVGISLCPELDVEKLLADVPADDKEARQQRLADAAFQEVTRGYKELFKAINDPSARGSVYVQPWKARPQAPLAF